MAPSLMAQDFVLAAGVAGTHGLGSQSWLRRLLTLSVRHATN
jgi:hypothetical protein